LFNKILEAADKIKDEYMKNFALNVFVNNFSELAQSTRIKKLSKDLLIDIIEYISLCFSIKSPSTLNVNNSSSNTLTSLNSASFSLTSQATSQSSSSLSSSHACAHLPNLTSSLLPVSILPSYTLHLNQLKNNSVQSTSSHKHQQQQLSPGQFSPNSTLHASSSCHSTYDDRQK
jgi:hypothetical protein